MDQIHLKAYAKVNLTLDIVGCRADGYHLLNSVMQSISLADAITLQKEPQGITIYSDHPLVPMGEKNICYRAIQAFQCHTQVAGGVKITLRKNIPMAAGLGGGSADAAAVLYGANLLFNTKLSLAELQEIGVQVGADVPFCLQGGTCLVQGIGEQVTALKSFPETNIVLVKPQAGVSTAEIYGRLPSTAHGRQSTARFLELLEENQGAEVLGTVLANALEAVTAELVPEVELWKRRLRAAGAHTALMSGSGPTVFGLFTRDTIAQEFKEHWGKQGEIFVLKAMPCGVEDKNGGDRQ